MPARSNRASASAIYPAAEDTILLAKGVERIAHPGGLAAEVGCGGGLVTETLAGTAREVLATDVDVAAAHRTWQRAKVRGLDCRVHVVCCDRLEAVREGEVFDLVAFNPPYLPDGEGDVQVSGGPTGVEVPLSFAASALRRLRRGGLLLFILSSLSSWLRALVELRDAGCAVSIVRVERVGLFEDLLLVMCVRRR